MERVVGVDVGLLLVVLCAVSAKWELADKLGELVGVSVSWVVLWCMSARSGRRR